MKSIKSIFMLIIAIINLIFIFRLIYLEIFYIEIDNNYYKKDIKDISIFSLDDTDVKEINKCTELEKITLTRAEENTISGFKNFPNLNYLMIINSEISSSDSEKISTFNNLKDLFVLSSIIDFKGFNSNTVSHVGLVWSNAKNFKTLSECSSLKKLSIMDTTVSDNCIVKEDYKYVIKDSSVFTSFDYIEELAISDINEIEDISGILEMDSLKTFKITEGAISEDDKKLLEDKGISVIENDENE